LILSVSHEYGPKEDIGIFSKACLSNENTSEREKESRFENVPFAFKCM
jgi:hypothetical protein